MPSILLARLSFIVATIVLPATLLHAALSTTSRVTGRGSLAGQLLIATPAMADPRFSQTVILMVRHDQNGALGIVINRPVEHRSLESLLQAMGEKDSAVAGSVRIFRGGPVQPEIGFVVHSADYHRADTIDIDGQVAVTSSREVLRDIGSGQGPKKSLVAFGYAGWAAGQLEGELAVRGWFTGTADAKLIFDDDRDKVWDNAMTRRTQDL